MHSSLMDGEPINKLVERIDEEVLSLSFLTQNQRYYPKAATAFLQID
jgi:hypothetical protein